ncbi:hypothetical protein Tco_0718520 [Tanacetum coccineum]
MKGPATPSEAARYKSDMKKALKVFDEPHLKGSNEEVRVTLEVPDGPADDSSSSSFEFAVEDISSDDDEVLVNDVDVSMHAEDVTVKTVIATKSLAEVTKNDNTVTLTSKIVKMTDDEIVTDDNHVTEEQIPEQQTETSNVDTHIAPTREAQTDFLNENEHADMNLSELLKNPGESEVQSMVDVPVTQATHAALRHPPIKSTMNLSHDTTTIPSSLPPPTQPKQVKTKSFVKKSTLPNPQDSSSPLENKVYRLERKLENATKKSIPTLSWSKADIKIYDQKDLLFKMMDKAKTFTRHPKHKALYDALAASLIVDEGDMDRVFDKKKKQKKPNSSKNEKGKADTLKQEKSSSKPSLSTQPVDADEGILDVETNAEDIGHNSTPSVPVANKPNWFKESPRPETPDSPDPD